MKPIRRARGKPSRRGGIKRAIAIWAAVAGAGFFLGKTIHHSVSERTENRPRIELVQTQNGALYAQPSLPMRGVRIPERALHFPDVTEGNLCTRYVHHAAKNLFNIEYERTDAWEFARKNKSIWKGSTTHVEEINPYLRPGQAIGLFNPKSNYNEEGRAYTHTALYLGNSNGKHWVMQRVGMNNRIDSLEQFLAEHPGWKIMEIIEPK